jgi:hypothetical protein
MRKPDAGIGGRLIVELRIAGRLRLGGPVAHDGGGVIVLAEFHPVRVRCGAQAEIRAQWPSPGQGD